MAVKYKDYYEVLGVSRGATDDQIRAAFRKLARKHHPDVNPGNKSAEEKFKELNEAYSVLSDPQKRKQYDTLGPNWKEGGDFSPPPGWNNNVHVEFGDAGEGFGGFSDFFSSIFGNNHGRGSQGFARRGRDFEAQIHVTLEEAHRGTTRTVSIRMPDGKQKSIRVTIPPGVSDGQLIRLPKEGGSGTEGAPSGDLFVEVKIDPHPIFTPMGDGNLEMNLPITPWEAALGANVRVPTIEGSVEMTIPPNAQTGQRLRLRGQSMHRRGGGRGDQYVRLQIVNPVPLSPQERELFRKLASESTFDPRKSLGGKQ